MRMVHAILVGGAVMLGAAAAQAAVGPYSTINPGTSHGINSTEAGVAGDTVGGTNVNTSNFSGGAPVLVGRASTFGAAPAH